MPTRRDLVKALVRAVGSGGVIWRPEDVRSYEYDGTVETSLPHAVVLPQTAEQVAAVIAVCNQLEVPITPRGAGTGLSGGAVARKRGVVISTARMNRILRIDPGDRLAVVQPGVANIMVSQAAAAHGLFFAPDPSSQKACTIGGNVAENAGGPHCLALGVTTNHVLGMEVVTADGTIVRLGGSTPDTGPGYDLRGTFIGSEGTLGVVTEVTLRLLPRPASVITLLAVFDTIEQASESVSAIIGAGLVPAAIEMMDRVTLQAAEAGLQCGYPPDAGAILLVEVDGIADIVEKQAGRIRAECLEHGAMEVRLAEDDDERERLWKGRKGAIGALGRIAPNYYILDGVVPRSRLVETMGTVERVSAAYGFPIANVFHAGDGNLHPCVLFDDREPGAKQRVLEAGEAIMRACVEAGGALSGEHGIGYEKQRFMPWLYSETDMENMERLRPAFGNTGLFNPCKMLPTGTGCGETAQNPAAIRAAGQDAYV
jgi:glycolate oxidase